MATTRPKATSDQPDGTSAARQPHVRSGKDNLREIIESVAIAFVIAFLFRAFEAEAFVIPTGSMAPTLMGEHKDLLCPECNFRFQVNASAEQKLVTSCICPNCRYRLTFGPVGEDGPVPPTYKGDRIIVAKFSYEVADPARWDVGVFKYPITPKVNFIKRIVGLPRERLRIYHGDIYTAPEGAEQFAIEQKPPDKVAAMLQAVYDNDYPVHEMLTNGWPERWQGEPGGQWRHPGGDLTRFETEGKSAETWLRYHHYVPSYDDWQSLKHGPLTPRELREIRPQFIGDFYAYDNGNSIREGQLHWVGDLALECTLDVRGTSGKVVLELIEANRAYHCVLDVGDGSATLSAEGLADFKPRASGPVIRGAGKHTVRFANVDDRLHVWVDGSLVEFDASTSYDAGSFRGPGPRDLAPAAVASQNVQLGVAQLRVLRDIYYIAERLATGVNPGEISDLRGDRTLNEFSVGADSANTNEAVADRFQYVQFNLESGQFLALGDNSPSSKDSRLWPTQHYVDRELLIGKAMFIYWPHALNRIPYTRIWFPLFPNIERMKFIH
jgi:signal peptidase I